jgi:hypothetical protein
VAAEDENTRWRVWGSNQTASHRGKQSVDLTRITIDLALRVNRRVGHDSHNALSLWCPL